MVAQRDRINPLPQQRPSNGSRDTCPRPRILPIGDYKIQLVLFPQSRHPRCHFIPSRTTHDIANK